MASHLIDRLLTPKKVFGTLAVVVLLILIGAPEPDLGEGTVSLTTQSTGSYGARGFYRTVQKLGWPVSRRTTGMRTELDSSVVYAVLDPPLPLTAVEVHNLLDAVRRGAGLIVVPNARTSLADSLEVAPVERYGGVTLDDATDTTITVASSTHDLLDNASTAVWLRTYLRPTSPLPDSTVSFVTMSVLVAHQRIRRPAVLGVPMGRGRAVIVAEPNMFRNGIVRDGDAGVVLVRALDWIAPRASRAVVFDEYHFGFGAHGDFTETVAHAMVATTAGRAALQVMIAGLVLLVATGARPIPPRDREIIERRSPLEHVGALARAYEQISATRLATRRLVRGLRRRHPLGGARGASDDAQYLEALSLRFPAAAPDVGAIKGGESGPLSPPHFAAVGRAIAHIERIVSS